MSICLLCAMCNIKFWILFFFFNHNILYILNGDWYLRIEIIFAPLWLIGDAFMLTVFVQAFYFYFFYCDYNFESNFCIWDSHLLLVYHIFICLHIIGFCRIERQISSHILVGEQQSKRTGLNRNPMPSRLTL